MAETDDTDALISDLRQHLAPAPATTPAPVASPAAPGDDTDALIGDLRQHLGGGGTQTQTQTSAQPALPERIVGGMALAMHDALDTPLEKVAGVFGYGDQVKANADAQRKQLEQAYGKSTVTQITKGVTQTGLTLAEMALVNPLVRGAVGAGSAAIRGAAPYVSNALDWGTRLLAGETALPTAAGRIATTGVQGAAAGAEASALNGDDPVKGALVGGAMGATAPTLLRGAYGFIAPKIEERLAQLGSMAKQYGINLGATQMGNSNVAHTLDYLGTSADNAATQGQVNRAIGQQIGIGGAEKLDPATVNRGVGNIRQTFDRIENTNSTGLDLTNDDLQRLADVESQANGTPSWGRVNSILTKLRSAIGNDGKIAGPDFHDLVQTNSPLSKAGNPINPELSDHADEIEDVLRGAFARSLTPEQLAEYNAARGAYKAYRTVAPLIDAQGNVAPGALMGRVARRYGNGDVADVLDGHEPMVDLARIGQIQQAAQRGAGVPLSMQLLSHLVTVGAGGGAGFAHGGLTEAIPGMLAGVAVPRALGAAGRAYYNSPLANQLMVSRALNPLYVPPLIQQAPAVAGALSQTNQ